MPLHVGSMEAAPLSICKIWFFLVESLKELVFIVYVRSVQNIAHPYIYIYIAERLV